MPKKVERAAVDLFELEELAAYLCGVDTDADEDADPDIYEAFEEKYGFDLDRAAELLGDLLPMVDVAPGTLSPGRTFRGFSKAAGEGGRVWLLRMMDLPSAPAAGDAP